MLLTCERKANQRDATLTSECHSVDHAAVPVRDDVVRLWLSRTAFEDGEYLTEQLTLSCAFRGTRVFWWWYASLFVLIYPVGVPLAMMILLFRHRARRSSKTNSE